MDFIHLTKDVQQVAEFPGVDSGLEQGNRSLATRFNPWWKPQRDGGEITELPNSPSLERIASEGIKCLGEVG